MVRRRVQAYRNIVIGLALTIVLSGCLTDEPVDQTATGSGPAPTSGNSPPHLTGNAPRIVKVGVRYSFLPLATDLDGDALTFSINNKPTWMTFDSGIGYLSGIPSTGTEGTYNDIEISAHDAGMSTMLPPFSITVESITTPNMPPEISGTPANRIIVGNNYSFTPSVSDPDGDLLTYSVLNLPSWATFNSATGRLSGMPNPGDQGTHSNIAITVSDSVLTSSLPAFSITVATANSSPQISGTPITNVTVDQNYLFTPAASDVDGDQLTYSIQNKPNWAQFSTSTGTLSGTPQAGDVGSYANILIDVSDGDLNDTLPGFAITVNQFGTGSATLNWAPPTNNDDGSPLTNLAGYKIYYGTSPGSYPNQITINNPGITSYMVDNLTSNTWYFVSTAFNSTGLESNFSNVATKTVN